MDINKARDMGWQWHQPDICNSFLPHFRQITMPTPHHSIFTGQILFLTPKQQCQSTEANSYSNK